MNYYEIVNSIYLFLLMLNILGFSALFFSGVKKIWPILLNLIIGGTTECITLLILYKGLYIFGEQTNAPFYHFNLWADLILFLIFFYSIQKSSKIKGIIIGIFIVAILLSLIPYLFLNVSFMFHSPYNPLFSKPWILIVCTLYFMELLNSRDGFPYIAIGIFTYTGTAIINMSTWPFYDGVNMAIHDFRNTIFLIPLIIMQLLFMFESYHLVTIRLSF